MITKKIRRKDDTELGKGSAKEERAALAAVARKHGISFWQAKTRARRPGRGSPGGKGVNAPRGRRLHKLDWATVSEYLIGGDIEADGTRANPDGEGRVEEAFALNCPTAEDGAPLDVKQIRETAAWMGETAAGNQRIRRTAVLQYAIALPEEETGAATPRFWRELAPRVLETLEMADHQALCVVHKDTAHPHMHILINRVHPTSFKAKSPFQDLVKLEQLMRKIEKEHGLRVVQGRFIDPETGKKMAPSQMRLRQPGKRASDRAVNEFARIAKPKLADKPFSNADSWEELEARLARDGYHLEAKGRGMVLCDEAGAECKLTKIAGKGGGRENLEARLGKWTEYVADKAEAEKRGQSVESFRTMRAVKVEAERAVEARKQREKVQKLTKAGPVMAGITFAREHEKCGVKLGVSETDLSRLLRELGDDDLERLRNDTRAKHDDAKDRTEGAWRDVEYGTRQALVRIELEFKHRGLSDIDEGAGKPTIGRGSGEVIRLDKEGDENAAQSVRDRLRKLSPIELLASIEATRAALQAEKKAGRQNPFSQSAKAERLLDDGLRALKEIAKERNIQVPNSLFVRTKAKRKGVEM